MDLSGARAVVVGAGIGGLAAAVALLREGVQVTLVERRHDLAAAQAGGGLHLWHNGVRALAELGLSEPVLELAAGGGVLHTAEFCNARGRVLATWPIRELEQRLGAPTVGVSRGRLHAILLEAAESADLRLATACTGVRQYDDHVVAELDDGTAPTVDVVIGADGLGSAVRRQLLGRRPARPAGYASWQAIVDFVHPEAPVGLFRVLWGPGARFLFYRLSETQLYWEGQFAAAPGGRDPSGIKAAASRRFAGYASPVREIVEATPEHALSRIDVFDRPPVRRWGQGNVTLLGDAAHPMTNAIGQGANQAIEDAVVLASCARTAASWPQALREYEARRRPRTAGMVRTAYNLQRVNRWQSPVACLLRDHLVRGGFPIALRKHAQDMAYAF